MLSHPDRDLVARDPSLPGLATVLDPAAMVAALRRFQPDLDDAGAAITYVRYKPGTGCLIGYELRIGGADLLLSVQARRQDAWDKLAKVADKPGMPGPLGPGRMLIPHLALAVSVFPNDRRLPRLKAIGDPAKRNRLIGKLGGDRPELVGASLEVLHYRPERRCVARLVGREGPLASVKFHGKADFPRAARNARLFESRGSLRVPDLIACSNEHGAVTSEWIPGQAAIATPEAAARAGAALVELHRQRSSLPAAIHGDDQERALHSIAHHLARLWPPLATRGRRLARRLSLALTREVGVITPIHGDFHADQMLLSDDRVAVIDFDEARLGDPAWDLGNFNGHLLYRDLAQGASGTAAEEIGAALLDAYGTAGGGVFGRQAGLQTALALFRLASRPFRERAPDWPERMAMVLDRVETVLDRSTPTVGTGSALRPAIDPAMPFLERALDPGQATQCIDLARLGPGAWRIAAARIVRHKPGRRCLINYDATNQAGAMLTLLGKARARGVDQGTYDLQRRLWDGTFGAEAPDGIQVPEPIAIVPELALWLQRKMPGVLLTDVLTSPAIPQPHRAASAIAKLHASGVPTRRRHAMADELRILRERFADLGRRDPDSIGRFDRMIASCEALAARALPVRPRPIHRDFYPDHLLFDGRNIYLLDLDLVCEGDPAVDVGNFLAHITEHSLRVGGASDLLTDWQSEFAAAYRRTAADVPTINIRIYELLSLARLAEIASRMPERRSLHGGMLSLCEERIDAELQDPGL